MDKALAASAQSAQTQTFEWIDQSTDGHVPKREASRKVIRRQAMRGAGVARKQSGAYGKVNLRQQPTFVETIVDQSSSPVPRSSLSSSSIRKFSEESDTSNASQPHGWDPYWFSYLQTSVPIPASLSSKGYQLARLEYGVDLPQLSSLSKVHFGRATCQILSKQPSMLSKLFCDDRLSYLGYIPSLYDHSSLIQDVTRCTLARAQQSLSSDPFTPSPTVLGLYGKALKSLQQALDDPARLREPEVLCATQILALFEILNFSENGAWMRHAAGAARLIELRGPHGYHSEFEKSLFMAQTGAMFSENILNNKACFLEKPEWQKVFASMAINERQFCDRSWTSVSLWMMKTSVPGLLRRTTALVCGDEPPDHHTVECLLQETRELRTKFQEWRFTYDCLVESRGYGRDSPAQHHNLRMFLAVCVTDLVLLARIMVALDPVGNWELEEQAQALAGLVVALKQEVAGIDLQANLFLTQKLGLAQAVIATGNDWRGARWQLNGGRGGSTVIARWVFEKWCALLGRPTRD